MDVLSTTLGVPGHDFWPVAQLQMPESLAKALQWRFYEPKSIYHTDPRLREYRTLLLLSELTPNDPTDWVTITDEASGQQSRLWRVWLRYREAPLLGELQYVAEHGWQEVIYHPTWLERRATPREYMKVSQGLAYLRQLIRRRGRPLGQPGEGVGSFDDLPTFLRHVEQGLTDFRSHDVEPTAPLMAELLNMSVRTMHRGLTRAGLRWANIKRTGIPESVKIFYGIL
jgi:hypothetical protein